MATDWGLWMLVVFNLYLLDFYQENPDQIKTLIFLYWTQSVFIGILTFLDLMLIRSIGPKTVYTNGTPISETFSSKGCAASFFAFHYGFFHFGYLIFIAIKIDGHLQMHFYTIGAAILAFSLILDFIIKKIREGNSNVNIGKVFFMPYIRIIPMHLAILLPEFIPMSNYTVFIALKISMDLLMHFVVSNHYKSHSLSSAP